MVERFRDREVETRAVALRDSTIAKIRSDLQQMLLSSSSTGGPCDFHVIEAYEKMLATWADFAQAISTSNPGFWVKDLPRESADDFERSQHAARILRMAYAPATGIIP